MSSERAAISFNADRQDAGPNPLYLAPDFSS
jgi:hypothetical protein